MTLNKRMDELGELLNVTEMKKLIIIPRYAMNHQENSSPTIRVIKLKYHIYAFHIVSSKIVV